MTSSGIMKYLPSTCDYSVDMTWKVVSFFSDMILIWKEVSTWQNGSRSLFFTSSVLTGTSWSGYHWWSIVQLEMNVSGTWFASSCSMTRPPTCSTLYCYFYLITCSSKKLFLLFCNGRPPRYFNPIPPFIGGFGETSGPITAIWNPVLAWLDLFLSLSPPFFPNLLPCSAKLAITMSAWFDWQGPLSAPSSQCAPTTVAPSISGASHGVYFIVFWCLNIARRQTRYLWIFRRY